MKSEDRQDQSMVIKVRTVVVVVVTGRGLQGTSQEVETCCLDGAMVTRVGTQASIHQASPLPFVRFAVCTLYTYLTRKKERIKGKRGGRKGEKEG